MSSPTSTKALYVSQSSNVEHQVKRAVEVKRGRVIFVVVECHCGSSSPLCTSVGFAREWWRLHAGLPAKVEQTAAYAGD